MMLWFCLILWSSPAHEPVRRSWIVKSSCDILSCFLLFMKGKIKQCMGFFLTSTTRYQISKIQLSLIYPTSLLPFTLISLFFFSHLTFFWFSSLMNPLLKSLLLFVSFCSVDDYINPLSLPENTRTCQLCPQKANSLFRSRVIQQQNTSTKLMTTSWWERTRISVACHSRSWSGSF